MQKPFHVIIAGAGLGGLALAQSLRRSNISVSVFERDLSPWDRPQGYRLHLEADALCAAAEVLPPELYDLFQLTSMRTRPLTTILTPDLDVLRRIETDHNLDKDVWPNASSDNVHCNVDRATLRQIMLAGLDDVCHFGKKLVRYESVRGAVTAHFDDGTTATGDVLVGADGIRSAVRAQRAPEARTMDAGLRAIYGRLPVTRARAVLPPSVFEDIFAIAIDERKVFLALGSVLFPTSPSEASKQVASPVQLANKTDYVVCIVGGRTQYIQQDASSLDKMDSGDLQAAASEVLAQWPGIASRIIEEGEPDSFFYVEMYTSVPHAVDKPTNVTFLGDAIHAMTPTLGRGANLAMRDGALLGRHLRAVAEGHAALDAALATYEESMLRYGFQVVRESVDIGRERAGQDPLP